MLFILVVVLLGKIVLSDLSVRVFGVIFIDVEILIGGWLVV